MSICIYDVDGYKGDFGPRLTVNEFEYIAEQLNLTTTIDFFKEGFTIELEQLISEWEQIDFSGFSEMQEDGNKLLDIFKKCKEIIILAEGLI